MLGNVWEWTSDWYGPYDASTQTDPIGASSGISRVRRGGSWRDPEDTLRCSYRLGYSPDRRLSGLGLRILRKEDEV